MILFSKNALNLSKVIVRTLITMLQKIYISNTCGSSQLSIHQSIQKKKLNNKQNNCFNIDNNKKCLEHQVKLTLTTMSHTVYRCWKFSFKKKKTHFAILLFSANKCSPSIKFFFRDINLPKPKLFNGGVYSRRSAVYVSKQAIFSTFLLLYNRFYISYVVTLYFKVSLLHMLHARTIIISINYA